MKKLTNEQKLAKEALYRYFLLKDSTVSKNQIILLHQTYYGAIAIFIFELKSMPYAMFRVEHVEPYGTYNVSLLQNTKTEFIELNSED